jgi:hypothetical protein
MGERLEKLTPGCRRRNGASERINRLPTPWTLNTTPMAQVIGPHFAGTWREGFNQGVRSMSNKKTHLTLVTSAGKTEMVLTRDGSGSRNGQQINHKLSQTEIRQLVKALAGLMK